MIKNNKFLVLIIISILIGLTFAKYVFNEYDKEVKTTFSESDNIYLFQYGAYNNKDIMIESCKNIKSYFYYLEDKKYHVIIGISKNKNLLDKIKKAYNIDSDIYIKEKNIKNEEFIENLKQYDILISNTDDDNTIINAEKQIMSKYEDLILKNE